MKPKIPESFLNEFEGLVARASDSQFQVGDAYLEGWAEFGAGWTNRYFDGDRKETDKWFKEALAAHSGIEPSTLRHHVRVSKHIPQEIRDSRPYLYSHYKAMLTGITEPFDEEAYVERLEWMDNHCDNHGGQPPSTRDIMGHVKGNGGDPKWKKRLFLLMSVGENIRDDEKAPEWLRSSVSALLDMIDEQEVD